MIYLRLAKEEDMSLVLSWRNNPQVYQGMYSQPKEVNPVIDWETHSKWWHSRNQDWREFLIMLNDGVVERPIGVITVTQLDYWSPEIGSFIGNSRDWGKGYAKQALLQAIEYIKEYARTHPHITHVRTTVVEGNEGGLKSYQSVGFEVMCKAREGELLLQRKI